MTWLKFNTNNLINNDMKNTTENNKLIAEFLGWYKPDEENYYVHKYSEKDYTDKQLKYHSSWDWLMPVVEKIDLILPDDNLVSISFNRCLIEYHAEGITFEGIGNTRIEATYKAVVEFILWYNENNKQDENN